MLVARTHSRRTTSFFVALVALLAFSTNTVHSQQSTHLITVANSRAITSGELVRVKKLSRDMANVRESIPANGPSLFQDKATLDKYIKRFGQFTDAIKRYSDFEHPDVLSAKDEYLALRKALSDEHKRAKQQTEAVGDVQSELRELEAKLQAMRAPKALTAPFSAQTAKLWVAAAVDAKKTAQSAAQRLPEISKTARLDKSNQGTVQQGAPYDHQDINRLLRFAQGTVQKVDESRDTTLSNIKAQLSGLDNELDYFRKLDPNNATHRMNAFLKEGAPEEIHTRLHAHLDVASSAAHFMAAFGKPPTAKVQNRIDEIEQLKIQYDTQLEHAAGAYKLPKAVSTDAERLAIAQQIIEKPIYKFGTNGPIVLTTADIIDREREESEEEFTDVDISLSGVITLTGTRTTWTYRWQEFKFATPLQDNNGNWYVWWITARNFSSGGGRTPIGKWVSGKAVKGSLIREENF